MHRSRRVLAALPPSCGSSRWPPVLAVAASPSPPAAGPPFPDPSMARPSTTTPASSRRHGAPGRADRRRHRGADEGRGRRLHAGPRARRHHDRGGRGHAAALMDQWGVGRAGINDGLVDPVRPRHDPRARPGPALRRLRVSCANASDELQAIFDDRHAAARSQSGDLDAARPRRAGPGRGRHLRGNRAGHRRRRRRRPAPPPGPPFPEPETDRAVYDYAGSCQPETHRRGRGDHRRDRGADRRRGRRLHPGQRRRTLTTEETEAKARALIDQWGIGREGLRRRHGHLLRHGPEPRARPGPAVRGARLRGRLPVEPGAPGDLRERHAAAPSRRPTSTARSTVALAKVDAAATPEHAAALAARAPGQRRARARRCADRLPRAVRLGVLPLAAVRQGPGLPRRPVDPDAGPAARPDRRIGGDGHGRRDVAAGPDDGDARPRVARPDRVPRGTGRPARRARRSASTPTPDRGRRRSSRRSARATRAARRARPRQSALRELRELGGRRGRRLHHARTTCPSSAPHVAEFDTALEGHVVERGWFAREAEQGRRRAGRAAACLAIVAGVIAIVAGLNIPISGPDPDRRRGDRRRHRRDRASPGRCRPSRCPAR